IDLHFDFHSFGQSRQTSHALVTTDAWLQEAFVPLLETGPFRTVKRGFPGSIALYTAARHGAHSATFEISQGRVGGETPRYVTIDDFRSTGVDFMKASYTLLEMVP
ncbi:MAG: hypothetical protein ACREIA_09475, partial [Opitutaceae bacterium]